MLLCAALVAVAPWLPPAAADMQIRLKDGRMLTVPVDANQVESITFGAPTTPAPGTAKLSPAARAAEKMRNDAARAAAAPPAVGSQPALREPAPATTPTPSPAAPSAPAQKGPRVLTVGPGAAYAVPSAAAKAARDGDIVEIKAGTYDGDVAVWHASNLVIRGVGGQARLEADGKAAQGKAIWVITGNNTTVENVTFVGCRVPDLNGAGIRLEGAGLTVRHSHFLNNEIGLQTSPNAASDVLVERSEFGANHIDYDRYAKEGRNVDRDINPGHNIYIGQIRSFTLRYSYVHHAEYGHNVKSRARRNVIAYNRIGDEKDGRSSYAIDLPNGGWSLVIGNTIQHGEHPENSVLFAFGAEVANADQPLYVVNNTFVNDKGAGIFINRRTPGPTLVVNNIFAGGGTPMHGGGATLRSNLIVERGGGITDVLKRLGDGDAASPGTGALKGNLVARTAGFAAASAYDYRLVKGSPAIDAGEDPGTVDGVALVPVEQYRHPLDAVSRRRVGPIDIGAYEFAP